MNYTGRLYNVWMTMKRNQWKPNVRMPLYTQNICTEDVYFYCLVHRVDANMAVGVMHTFAHVHTHACTRICTCNIAQQYKMQGWKGCTWECCVLYIDCVTASVFKAILACFSAALFSLWSCTVQLHHCTTRYVQYVSECCVLLHWLHH